MEFRNELDAREYLINTGWIWEKYARNVQLLKTISEDEFRVKYADIIAKQEEARAFLGSVQ